MTWDTERLIFAEKIHRAFGISAPRAIEFSGWILEAARRQDLPPELLASLVFAESSFRKAVQSSMARSVQPRYGAATGSPSAAAT